MLMAHSLHQFSEKFNEMSTYNTYIKTLNYPYFAILRHFITAGYDFFLITVLLDVIGILNKSLRGILN